MQPSVSLIAVRCDRLIDAGSSFLMAFPSLDLNGFAALAKAEASDTRELVHLLTHSGDFAYHSWCHRNGRFETAPSY